MAQILIAFDSTQQAIRTEMLLEFVDIDIDTRPTPKEITAGCALSIEFPEEDLHTAVQVVREEKVEVRGFFRKEGESYIQLSI